MKPQLALAAPAVLALRSDWRGFAGCAIVGFAALGAELAVFGVQPWIDWIHGFAFFHRVVVAVRGNVGSANPAGFAEFIGLPIVPFWIADAFLAGWLIRSRARSDDPLELAAVVVIGSIFLSPYAIVYDLGAAMPFMAMQALRAPDRRPFLLALLWPWTSAAIVWSIIATVRPLADDRPEVSTCGEVSLPTP